MQRKTGVLACHGRRASGLLQQPRRLFAMTPGTAVFRYSGNFLDIVSDLRKMQRCRVAWLNEVGLQPAPPVATLIHCHAIVAGS